MKIKEERRNRLVEVLSDVLTRLCERNDRFMMNHTPVTRFQALRAPQIAIKAYLKRIVKYSNCSEECFILALIYIDRLIKVNEKFMLNSLNVHRLMITSVMLGAKFFDDQYYNNAHFGKVGGVSCKEINLLEIEFVFMINFNLYVDTDLYETYSKRLESHAQPINSDCPLEKNNIAETKATFPEPVRAAKAPKTRIQSFENASMNSSQSTARPIHSAAHSGNSPNAMRSRPWVSQMCMPRIQQRCTPLSPKFLKTLRRIHMKTN